MKQVILSGIAVLSLSGCAGLLQPRLAQPSGPMSLSSGHQVVFTDSGSRGVHIFDTSATGRDYRVCIEPSPDTGVNQSEDISIGGIDTSRSAGGEFNGVRVGTSAQAAGLTSARDNDTVISRDEVTLLFRDTLFQSCLAYAQGLISEEEYTSFLRASTGAALSMSAMNAIAGSDGTDDPQTAEIISALGQMALYGLLITDAENRDEVSDVIQRIAELKSEQIAAMVESLRLQNQLIEARIAAGQLD